MAYIYDTHGCDLKMNCRSGEEVTVIHELTEKEADIDEVGPMYKVMFSDGLLVDAYDDELIWIKKEE